MNLATTILLAESAIAPTHRHHAVMSPHMREKGGHTHSEVKREHVKHSAGHHSGKHGVRHSGLKHGKPGGKGLPITHVKVHLVKPHFIKADASASDVANHHSMQEPSASDVQMLHWKTKRVFEKIRKRNLDPYEALKASKETGPCGCTLKLGERVTVDGVGRGKIKSRNERMLTVALDNGRNRVVDQKFVHRMASARR
jgi:hypothetical protein